ncbi:integrase arm-type DNA-binding domain-containing protein [Desulfovibrio sp. OttesenSCG-928-O18]|nr:integrase arm-type DNA-binding domain-containing protein [Desulfovibrio sp. OttesenSCG-928-O18]
MKLTDTFLRGLKANGKTRKYSDGGGLYVHVSPTGGRLWRMGYRFCGKQKTLCFGAYPSVSLKTARIRRAEAKELLAAGIDPGEHKKAVKAAAWAEAANSFEVVAREWFGSRKHFWAANHAENVIGRLERYIFPAIGAVSVSKVTAPAILAALRRIEAKGTLDTAHRALQNCGQIFRYAITTGRAERDPAADLKGALPPVKSVTFATITDPAAIGALLRDIDAYAGNSVVRAALRMAPYVFVRPGELRRAEWAEIRLNAAEWRIPAERMKTRIQHIVPLASQVVAMLRELHRYTGRSTYLFPSMRANNAPISDMTLLAGLRRMGYDRATMTVHGFRGMASTLLNEQGYNRDWIERQLAHTERNGSRAAYNHAEYLFERRRMMQEWADYLDELRGV